jgi:ribosomal protein S18 acetylase RimI-like enzyme
VTVHIVPASAEDAGELLTLQRAAYLSEGRLHDRFDLPPLTETLDEVRAAVARGLVLKALRGTRIVGTVRGVVLDRTGHIGRFAVAPDLQGHGIGSTLLREIESSLAEYVDRFELFTGPHSEANIRLYLRFGYQPVPTPPGREPFVFMAKPLR